jgi:DHA3 family macrolide efflux protein-like MFS transporter
MFNYAVVSIFFAGLMLPVTNGSFFAILQSKVPPEMQGRFFTLVSALSTAMNPIGLAFAGPATDVIGVTIWYLLAGAGMIVLGLVAVFVPTIRNIEENMV